MTWFKRARWKESQAYRETGNDILPIHKSKKIEFQNKTYWMMGACFEPQLTFYQEFDVQDSEGNSVKDKAVISEIHKVVAIHRNLTGLIFLEEAFEQQKKGYPPSPSDHPSDHLLDALKTCRNDERKLRKTNVIKDGLRQEVVSHWEVFWKLYYDRMDKLRTQHAEATIYTVSDKWNQGVDEELFFMDWFIRGFADVRKTRDSNLDRLMSTHCEMASIEQGHHQVVSVKEKDRGKVKGYQTILHYIFFTIPVFLLVLVIFGISMNTLVFPAVTFFLFYPLILKLRTRIEGKYHASFLESVDDKITAVLGASGSGEQETYHRPVIDTYEVPGRSTALLKVFSYLGFSLIGVSAILSYRDGINAVTITMFTIGMVCLAVRLILPHTKLMHATMRIHDQEIRVGRFGQFPVNYIRLITFKKNEGAVVITHKPPRVSESKYTFMVAHDHVDETQHELEAWVNLNGIPYQLEDHERQGEQK